MLNWMRYTQTVDIWCVLNSREKWENFARFYYNKTLTTRKHDNIRSLRPYKNCGQNDRADHVFDTTSG